MKELYYSKSSINHQARFFQKRLFSLCERREYHIDPDKVALLVIDFQRFFFDTMSHAFVPSAEAIIPKVVKLQKHCLKNGIKVIHTCHTNTEDDVGMMKKWWFGHPPTEKSEFNDIINEVYDPAVTVVKKSQYDAFYNTNLEEILRNSNISQLVITGVMANLCCESTARSGFARGYEIFFSIDGTATYNRDFHIGTLMNSAYGFATPLLVEEILNRLKSC